MSILNAIKHDLGTIPIPGATPPVFRVKRMLPEQGAGVPGPKTVEPGFNGKCRPGSTMTH